MTIEIVGDEIEVAVVVHETAIDAAVVEVADAVQGCGIGDRERLQQDGVDEGKDGDVGSDAMLFFTAETQRNRSVSVVFAPVETGEDGVESTGSGCVGAHTTSVDLRFSGVVPLPRMFGPM